MVEQPVPGLLTAHYEWHCEHCLTHARDTDPESVQKFAQEHYRTAQHGHRGISRAGPTGEQLAKVAEIAASHPRTPTAAVSLELGISHRTATNWIKKARESGFLT